MLAGSIKFAAPLAAQQTVEPAIIMRKYNFAVAGSAQVTHSLRDMNPPLMTGSKVRQHAIGREAIIRFRKGLNNDYK